MVMMGDLVKRLRGRTQKGVTGETALLLHEAADRIEQLERELSLERHKLTESEKVWIATAQKAYDQLAAEKALADRLIVAGANALQGCDRYDKDLSDAWDSVCAAYRKARGL